MGVLKKIKKKVSDNKAKKKASPKQKKVHPKVKKFKTKIKNKLKKTDPVTAAFAAVIPFKMMMKKQLDKRGISHDNKLATITQLFVEKVIEKKNFTDRHSLTDNQNFVLTAATAAAIVNIVVKFIKNLIAKKKAEQASPNIAPPITGDEKEMIDDAEKGVEDASEAEDEDEDEEIKRKNLLGRILDTIFPSRLNFD